MPIGRGAPTIGPADEARALLDQLMGNERDVKLDERTNKKRHFTDEDVCKYHLCGLSPYTLFRNTKSDLMGGDEYDKKVCEESKAQWEALSQEEKDKYGYEWELKVCLEKLVRDVDHKVRRGNERVAAEERQLASQGLNTQDLEEEKQAYLKKAEELNDLAEKAGEEGDVDKATELMQQAKDLQTNQVANVDSQIHGMAKKMGLTKKLILCEVTGNFLSSTDNDERIQVRLPPTTHHTA